MNNVSITSRAMAAATRNGLTKTKVRPHTLILGARLDPAESAYDLDLRDEKQALVLPGVTRGLIDRDGFIASAMGLALYSVPFIGDKEYTTNGQLTFFPDANIFSAPAAAPGVLTEAQQLESIYMGDHTLQTNEGIRMEKNPNILFRTAQQTQASAATSNMLTGIEYKDLGADVRFGGGDDNLIRIIHKSMDKSLIGGPADRNNYILVFLLGVVLKGGTTKAYLG
jgi:hypothetical protein